MVSDQPGQFVGVQSMRRKRTGRVETMIAIRKTRADGCRAYRPTLGEIRRACEKIQATWSPQERSKRARRMRAVCWTVPLIRLAGLTDLDLVEPIDGKWEDRNFVPCLLRCEPI